jgi:hypothetical protein
VPAACAAFSGGWGGEWPAFGFASLWVVTIDGACSARVVYPGGPLAPKPGATLSDGAIGHGSLQLKRPDGGTVTFELAGDSLNATYTGPTGSNHATLTRIPDDPAAQTRLQQQLRAVTVPVPVAADVPKECADFHGNWTGRWSQAGGGTTFFRVVEAQVGTGGDCTIRFSYTPFSGPIPARDTATVRAGSVSFLCNPSTGGTCVFVRRGDAIEGTYSNPQGGRNAISLQRLP